MYLTNISQDMDLLGLKSRNIPCTRDTIAKRMVSMELAAKAKRKLKQQRIQIMASRWLKICLTKSLHLLIQIRNGYQI